MNKDQPVKKTRKEKKKKKENQKGKTSFSHASVGKKYLFPHKLIFPHPSLRLAVQIMLMDFIPLCQIHLGIFITMTDP